MADITEAELEQEIAKILENADLAKTSTKKVIQQLEKKLGIELKDKKNVIDKLVMNYVNSKESGDEDEEEDEDDDDKSEEEEKKKPAKRGAPKKKESEDEESEEEPKKKSKRQAPKDRNQSDDDDDASEEEKKPVKKKGRKKKGSDDDDDDWNKKKGKPAKGKKAGGRGKGGGYTRAYKLSPALADLMGKDEMPRHEVVKRVWEIIKEKQLYDPNNKQFAVCDDALYKVFGTKRFRCFGMMKYLKSHFLDE